ncbi:hypothetical protein E2493_00385 [Sphingomonas parva]|uniref:Uncharacterized protein n=1 Tax=Sphingomonas parva TaxID=2555898 RepID=A0A4Y8ZXF7_9SPHN|nr:hypothetical protein [Sphingomonas parva]TFI60207.1 hypothetical protein E2493_00385 [Sphingomonas parva]
MIHLASALFFTLALLAALTTLHVVVQLSWSEIVAALRGELGREFSPRRAASATPRRHAVS